MVLPCRIHSCPVVGDILIHSPVIIPLAYMVFNVMVFPFQIIVLSDQVTFFRNTPKIYAQTSTSVLLQFFLKYFLYHESSCLLKLNVNKGKIQGQSTHSRRTQSKTNTQS